MSIRTLSRVWDYSQHEGSALLIMLALADYANDGGYCFPSIPALARKARVSERTVMRLLKEIEESGEVTILHKRNSGNRYWLNVWPPEEPKEEALDNGQCPMCRGKKYSFGKDFKFEKHHIIPKRIGGSDEKENIIALCTNCHHALHRLIETEIKNVSDKMAVSEEVARNVTYQVTTRVIKVPEMSLDPSLSVIDPSLKDTTSPTAKSTPKEPKTQPKIPVKEKLSELEYAEPGSEFDSDKGDKSSLAKFIEQEMHHSLSNTNLRDIGMTYTEHTTRGRKVHPSPDQLWIESEIFRDYIAERVKYFKDGSGTPAARRNRLVHLICNYKAEPFGWFAQKVLYEGYKQEWTDV